MTTIIKHYRNSFLDIESKDLRVLMDPWLNTANEGSWAAAKEGNEFIFQSLKNKEIDFIYISHLHTDHFDKKLLIDLKKKQKKIFKFIIKKFRDNRLKNYLLNCGFKKEQIIDLKEFEVLNLNKKSKFIILPQESSSNTPNYYVKYDLDTSCVYTDDNVSIYNQVDNPYSLSDISNILKKLKKKLNFKFDLAFIPYCAASEFPQSFINLNRIKEKKNIINSRVKKFINIGNKINCKMVIPAGGSYLLDNIFSNLNKYVAVPDFKKVKNILNKNSSKKFSIVDTNKFYFLADKHNINLKKNFYSDFFKSTFSKNKENISYNNIKSKFSKEKITENLKKLDGSLPHFKKELYNKTNTEVELNIWQKQPVLIKNLKRKKADISHNLFSNQKKKIKLKIHMYYKLLLAIISNKVSWNEVQNHCLYERRPNKYDPDTVMWLNLYKF